MEKIGLGRDNKKYHSTHLIIVSLTQSTVQIHVILILNNEIKPYVKRGSLLSSSPSPSPSELPNSVVVTGLARKTVNAEVDGCNSLFFFGGGGGDRET
jgi:hypothetical protein